MRLNLHVHFSLKAEKPNYTKYFEILALCDSKDLLGYVA